MKKRVADLMYHGYNIDRKTPLLDILIFTDHLHDRLEKEAQARAGVRSAA